MSFFGIFSCRTSRAFITVVRVQQHGSRAEAGMLQDCQSPAGRSRLAPCCVACGTAVAFVMSEVLFQHRRICVRGLSSIHLPDLIVAAADCLSRPCANKRALCLDKAPLRWLLLVITRHLLVRMHLHAFNENKGS